MNTIGAESAFTVVNCVMAFAIAIWTGNFLSLEAMGCAAANRSTPSLCLDVVFSHDRSRFLMIRPTA
jgi:hypothetical protein